jgi:hypothetical protein
LRKIHEVLLEVCCMIFPWIRVRDILDVGMHDSVAERLWKLILACPPLPDANQGGQHGVRWLRA